MSEKLSTKSAPTECSVRKADRPGQPNLARRVFLAASGTAALLLGTQRPNSANAKTTNVDPVPQPPNPSASAFIERAFEMRQKAIELGDQAYGAVVVRNGLIIGQSWSRVTIDEDPTGHAEMAAIRDTARRLGSRDLNSAILYSSSRPCPMCEAAAYWAGIGKMVHGRDGDNAGAPKLCR